MSSLQKQNDLEDFILYEAKIKCEECEEEDITGFTDDGEASYYFYDQGWRVMFIKNKTTCLCPSCTKRKN